MSNFRLLDQYRWDQCPLLRIPAADLRLARTPEQAAGGAHSGREAPARLQPPNNPPGGNPLHRCRGTPRGKNLPPRWHHTSASVRFTHGG